MEKIRNNDDVFIRCVNLGVVKTFTNKITWTNRFSSGDVNVVVPAYFSMAGDDQFLMDAFVDDYPGERPEMNVDQVQRIHLYPTSYSIQSAEMTNPNTYIGRTIETDTELKKVFSRNKLLPISINYAIKLRASSELELYRMWDGVIDNIVLYKRIDFFFRGVPVYGWLTMPDDVEIKFPREIELKSDSTKEITLQAQLKTVRLIPEPNTDVDANNRVNWSVNIFDAPTIPE